MKRLLFILFAGFVLGFASYMIYDNMKTAKFPETKEGIAELMAHLGKEFRPQYPYIAVALYSLSGAIHGDDEDRFAALCAKYSLLRIAELKGGKE